VVRAGTIMVRCDGVCDGVRPIIEALRLLPKRFNYRPDPIDALPKRFNYRPDPIDDPVMVSLSEPSASWTLAARLRTPAANRSLHHSLLLE